MGLLNWFLSLFTRDTKFVKSSTVTVDESIVIKQPFNHLPKWTNKEATKYFRSKGYKQFSTAYLNTREWLFKNGTINGTVGYREYVLCDDGIERPIGKPLARRG